MFGNRGSRPVLNPDGAVPNEESTGHSGEAEAPSVRDLVASGEPVHSDEPMYSWDFSAESPSLLPSLPEDGLRSLARAAAIPGSDAGQESAGPSVSHTDSQGAAGCPDAREAEREAYEAVIESLSTNNLFLSLSLLFAGAVALILSLCLLFR